MNMLSKYILHSALLFGYKDVTRMHIEILDIEMKKHIDKIIDIGKSFFIAFLTIPV